MAAGEPRRHRALPWVALVLALALMVAVGAGYRLEWGERWLADDRPPAPIPSARPDPAVVEPPPALRLPAPRAAPAVAATQPRTEVDRERVRRAVGRLLAARELGRRVVAAVASLEGGAPLVRRGSGAAIPASVQKLVTGAAALSVLGPDATFRTSAVTGRTVRDVILVGGGDPYLARPPLPPGERALEPPPPADLAPPAPPPAAPPSGRGIRGATCRRGWRPRGGMPRRASCELRSWAPSRRCCSRPRPRIRSRPFRRCSAVSKRPGRGVSASSMGAS